MTTTIIDEHDAYMENARKVYNEKAAKLIGIAQDVAKALGNGWTYRPEEEGARHADRYVRLCNGKGLELSISVNWKGKASIGGAAWPKDENGRFIYASDVKTYEERQGKDLTSIGVSLEKPAESIAKDIVRRLLPHYEELYKRALEHGEKSKKAAKARLGAMERLGWIVGVKVSQGQKEKPYLYSYDTPSLKVETYHDGDRFKIALDDLTLEQAEKVLQCVKGYLGKA